MKIAVLVSGGVFGYTVRMKTVLLCLLIIALGRDVLALGGHELLVLANGKSAASVRVARKFVALRGIPEQNLVYLPVPDDSVKSPGAISQADFTRYIWLPALRAMEKRGIGGHVLAWVYSTDFPVMIAGAPGISIQGITFLRNRLPAAEKVQNGSYESPLFAGPSSPAGPEHFPQTLDVYRRWLGEEMPIPSMMLGYTGERGNSESEVVACLERGLKADQTCPTGTVYFVTSADVRSRCRQWQFPRAVEELKRLGIAARITDAFPVGRSDVLGLMVGQADVRPAEVGAYLPGAMAEHLTSFAAVFSNGDQTKLSAWLSAGASASAGTVVEPLSIWAKFPSARFFVHYASGCTMIESFFQSIRCPLQILVVGDPLIVPWLPAAALTVQGLEPAGGRATLELRAEVVSARGDYSDFLFLLDGKPVADKAVCRLSAGGLTDGVHVLRVVAYGTGLVRPQVFEQKSLKVSGGKVEVLRR